MLWFFGRQACGILASQPGIEPTPHELEGEVLTTGPPGKSLWVLLFIQQVFINLLHSNIVLATWREQGEQ